VFCLSFILDVSTKHPQFEQAHCGAHNSGVRYSWNVRSTYVDVYAVCRTVQLYIKRTL